MGSRRPALLPHCKRARAIERSDSAPIWMPCRSKKPMTSITVRATPARCMPAAMTGTPRCCSAPRATRAGNPTFDGRVHFIFQPAEEGLGGAKAMIAEGLFDRFPMDNVYGMHNSPANHPGPGTVTSAVPYSHPRSSKASSSTPGGAYHPPDR